MLPVEPAAITGPVGGATLQSFRQGRGHRIAPGRRIHRAFGFEQCRPLIAQQMQEIAHLGPMLRQRHRYQRVELCEIGALRLCFGKEIGQPAPKRRGLREGQCAAALLQIPALHQRRQ